MPIDPEIAIGAELPDKEFSWTSTDVQLYHLALGAGTDSSIVTAIANDSPAAAIGTWRRSRGTPIAARNVWRDSAKPVLVNRFGPASV